LGGGRAQTPPPKTRRKTWPAAAKQKGDDHTVEVILDVKTLVCMRPISPTDALVIPATAESVGIVKEYVTLCAGLDEFSPNTYILSGLPGRGSK